MSRGMTRSQCKTEWSKHRAIDIAWAAGFWEGEGCVYVQKHRAVPDGPVYRYFRVSASQKEPECLERLKALFGGCVCVKARKHQTLYEWTIVTQRAEAFIDFVLPYLSQRRREQIEKARAGLLLL